MHRFLICLLLPAFGLLAAIFMIILNDIFFQNKLQELMNNSSKLFFEQVKGTELQSIQRGAAFLMLVIGIYFACIASAIAYERYNRSLFTLHFVSLLNTFVTLTASCDFDKYYAKMHCIFSEYFYWL